MTPKAPDGLSPETAAWWRLVAKEYQLQAADLRLLTVAAWSWQRLVEARQQIAKDGAYLPDRFNQLKAHPALAVESDSRLGFMRALRELNLDADQVPDSRPPEIRGRYR